MGNESVRLVLNIEKSKLQAFMDMLKLFDFVTIESNEEFLKRFMENAPTDETLSEEEVMEIVTQLRYNKSEVGRDNLK